jgi:polyhydroxybutyrate depolymerase
VSTLREYARFVQMLAEGGQYGSVRVLKPATVDRMFTSATDGMKVRMESFGADKLAYGFATWLQQLPDGVVRASDPGAFGFTPWIDRDLGVYGVFAVRDQVGRVLPRLQPVQQAARDLVKSPVVAGKDEVIALEHGGRTRRYVLHTPPRAEKALQLPLMVVLHGGGGSGAQAAESTGFSALADRHGFVVAYPDGTGPLRGRLLTWNSGGIPVYASDEKIDDTDFLRAMVASAKTKVAIDPERIYATGISNGAMMCHRLAREAPDLFAAIAPVSGAMNFTAVDSAVPIAVMIIHGTDDEHVRYEGGKPGQGMGRAALRKDASVDDAIAYYRKRNHLTASPELSERDKVKVATWQGVAPQDAAAAPLRVVTLVGGKHAWPGGKRGDYRGADEPFDWPASEQIWEFVSAQRLRTR